MTNSNDVSFFSEFPIPTYQQWQTKIGLTQQEFTKQLTTSLYEGIRLQPMYQRQHLSGIPYLHSLPGEYPFIRGTKTKKDIPWEISQEIDDSLPEEWNKRAIHALQNGQTSLHIVLSEMTKRASIEYGEENGTGLHLYTIDDVEASLHNLSIVDRPVHIYCGATSLPILAMIAAVVEKETKPIQQIKGCIGADPIGEWVERGSLPYTIKTYFDAAKDVLIWKEAHVPDLQTILVRGDVYHNGGASAVEELAFSLTTGIAYLQELTERGISVDKAARAIRFSFSIGSNFFIEIAKLRVARMLWASIVEKFGGEEEAQKLFIHARTSAWTKTKDDIYVNMLRSTTEALAAAIGGADSIHVSRFDEAKKAATKFSSRMARNTSIILQEETHISTYQDPAGGSWYVERITKELAEKAWLLIQQVEKQGGILASLQAGFPQKCVAKTRNEKLNNIDSRADIMVGVNRYLEISKENDINQHRNKEKFKQWYKQKKKNLQNEQTDGHLTMERAITMAQNNQSIETIARSMGGQVERDDKIKPIKATRASQPFEDLREASKQYQLKNGDYPLVCVVAVGTGMDYQKRFEVIAEFFEAGAFTVKETDITDISETAVAIVICGSDEDYKQKASAVILKAVESNSNCSLFVAGNVSPPLERKFISKGVDQFIHERTPCYSVLATLQRQKGVRKDE
ncbi:acyl-CoA mutase large subunit family protein [Bacillus alkalicellulosilyticus]|uniref:acyl-CoA mutase large subunit family protein n=1 Tax=Alkalihalobacterium alkalicellulosilyticum TaxID=1912214 RepID=UPI000996CDA0|nr:acyl-CoA mutase large subunit family protein [Bacillus alkalicellulosilyticus]